MSVIKHSQSTLSIERKFTIKQQSFHTMRFGNQIWRLCNLLLKLIIAALLYFPLTAEEKASSDEVQELRVFPHRILPVGDSSEPAASAELLSLLKGNDKAAAITDIESFLERNPGSEWRPSLESNLGAYYLGRGRYTDALNKLQSAWERTRKDEGNGRIIADNTLPPLLKLLSSLGRADELAKILGEIAERPLPPGFINLSREYAAEAYHMMITYPEKSFRCGTLALRAVGEKLGIEKGMIGDLVDVPSGKRGFTMRQLIDLGRQRGIDMVGVEWAKGERLIIPTLIHWRQNHYAAVLEEFVGEDESLRYLVQDPTDGRPKWLEMSEIGAEASGFMLIPDTAKSQWRRLEEAELDAIYGKGIANNIADSEDNGCPPGKECKSCPGIPVWWVTEPYLNLFVADEPLSYFTKGGEKISFRVTHKQRDTRPPDLLNAANAPRWSTSWSSYIRVTELPPWEFFEPFRWWKAELYLPGGGELTFSHNDMVDDKTQLRLEPVSGYNQSPDPQSSVKGKGFRLIFPDGSQWIYNRWNSISNIRPSISAISLTHQIDANGRTNRFDYGEISTKPQRMIDHDGQTNVFTYSGDNLQSITDPYNRTASFTYNSSNWVSSITDAAGMTSTFKYDSAGWITNITTPYGVTGFDYPHDPLTTTNWGNAGEHNKVNRAIR